MQQTESAVKLKASLDSLRSAADVIIPIRLPPVRQPHGLVWTGEERGRTS